MKPILTFPHLNLQDLHREAKKRLAAQQQKYTRSREQIIQILGSSDIPLTVLEILDEADGLVPSSTYRNLDVLSANGLVAKVSSEGHGHFELAEPFKPHHHHIICVKCGQVQDIALTAAIEKAISSELAQIAGAHGFKAITHTLDLLGHCATCDINQGSEQR